MLDTPQASKEILKLREQNELLTERLKQLEREYFNEDIQFPTSLVLSRQDKIILRLLLKYPLVTDDMMMSALYRDLYNDQPNVQVLRTLIARCRKALRRYGVEIITHVREGYSMSSAMKTKLRELLVT